MTLKKTSMFVSLEQQKVLLHDVEFLLDLIVYSDTCRALFTRSKVPVIKSRAFNLENVLTKRSM